VTKYPVCTNANGKKVFTGETIELKKDSIGTGKADARLSIVPLITEKNTSVVVRWHSADMKSCKVSGDNGDAWVGLSGELISKKISERVQYTLTCEDMLGKKYIETLPVSVM
jgi:hypothetical protein